MEEIGGFLCRRKKKGSINWNAAQYFRLDDDKQTLNVMKKDLVEDYVSYNRIIGVTIMREEFSSSASLSTASSPLQPVSRSLSDGQQHIVASNTGTTAPLSSSPECFSPYFFFFRVEMRRGGETVAWVSQSIVFVRREELTIPSNRISAPITPRRLA